MEQYNEKELKKEVLQIAEEKVGMGNMVVFLRAKGYWGAPVGRRTDAGDWMKIWVAAKLFDEYAVINNKSKKEYNNNILFLQAAKNGVWGFNIPLIDGVKASKFATKCIGKVKEYAIMEVDCGYDLNSFIDEFVLRLDSTEMYQPVSFYDNNNGKNYRLSPYGYGFDLK
jgi:hypothetical protein